MCIKEYKVGHRKLNIQCTAQRLVLQCTHCVYTFWCTNMYRANRDILYMYNVRTHNVI